MNTLALRDRLMQAVREDLGDLVIADVDLGLAVDDDGVVGSDRCEERRTTVSKTAGTKTVGIGGGRPRLRTFLAVASLGLGLVAGDPIPSVAGAAPGAINDCSSWDYGCVAGTGYTGQAGWGYDGPHNCTLYAAYRLNRNGYGNPSGLGNAINWDDEARRRYIPVDGIPRVGSIAQWESPPDGHVAYVEAVRADHTVISEDAWPSGPTKRARVYRGANGYAGIDFIHFRDLTQQPMFGSTWLLSNTLNDSPHQIQFGYGQALDIPLSGDWNGDGIDTPGIFRGGMFYLSNSFAGGNADIVFGYGVPSDTPLVGDWNGDGIDTVAVRRGSNTLFSNYLDGRPHQFGFWWGEPTDTVLVGDWNGDGIDTLAVRRGSNTLFSNYLDGRPHQFGFWWGDATDRVVVGDWNGVGGSTVGLIR
ncbi:MAG: CHAP domain-containing protein [Acidimicrobiales bacterium]